MTKHWSSERGFQLSQQLLVIIMLSALTQLFSSPARAGEKAELSPRQVELSDNVFRFSIPEDFSKDMPAHNMVESLDIADPEKFNDPEYGNLIRRWWDIKEPGWFGKELGTVMMDISVQRVAENNEKLIHDRPYELRDRLDFILMLNDRYHQRYDALNAEMGRTSEGSIPYHSDFATLSGADIHSIYREHEYNGQKWIQTGISAPRGNLILSSNLPLSDNIYLEATFTYASNDNVSPRDFRDAAFAKMATIQESFSVQYAEGNPFSEIVGGEWLEQTNDEVLEQHREDILNLFYAEPASLEAERKLPPGERD